MTSKICYLSLVYASCESLENRQRQSGTCSFYGGERSASVIGEGRLVVLGPPDA
jgi:hypothetical protein